MGQNSVTYKALGRLARAACVERERLGWRKAIPAGILLSLGVLLFTSTGRDDSHITYWVADALSRSGSIINYNGEMVEQSSSLTHVLLLASLAKTVPLSLPTLGMLVGIFFGAATVVITQSLASLVNPRTSFFAGLITAVSPGLVYWSFGGLESTLAAFLGVWLILCYVRCLPDEEHWYRPTVYIVTVLYLLVRPEAIAVILSVLFGAIVLLLLRFRFSRKKDIVVSGVSLKGYVFLFIVVLMMWVWIVLFRFIYFGSIFPQPVNAKSSGVSIGALRDGIAYLKADAWNRLSIVLWVVAACGVGRAVYRAVTAVQCSAAEVLTALFVLAYTAFVVLAGGDWMEGGRFLVPVLPMVVVMATHRLEQSKFPNALIVVNWLLICLQLGGTFHLAKHGSSGGPIWTTVRPRLPFSDRFSWFENANRVHVRDIPLILRLEDTIHRLRERRSERISIMSGQMGMVAYYIGLSHFGDVRMLDRYALTTSDFTSCPITGALPRGATGLSLTYDFFFHHRKEIAEACNFREPEIIFDIEKSDESKMFQKNGYTIIYRQVGMISNGSELFPGAPVPMNQYIAVRNDVVEAVQRGSITTK